MVYNWNIIKAPHSVVDYVVICSQVRRASSRISVERAVTDSTTKDPDTDEEQEVDLGIGV